MREKSAHQQRVEKFMALANQEVPGKPTIPDEKTRRFRAKIILEEALETIEGLGFEVVMKPADGELDMGPEDAYSVSRGELEIGEQVHEPDMVKIVDGCADVIVVTTGTLSACGVADCSVQDEVDQSNLRKFGPGSYKREDGKWMKPPDFRPPDIEAVLAAQAK
jgi:predicted HAD superfamily Cof-like phosphohydrolase